MCKFLCEIVYTKRSRACPYTHSRLTIFIEYEYLLQMSQNPQVLGTTSLGISRQLLVISVVRLWPPKLWAIWKKIYWKIWQLAGSMSPCYILSIPMLHHSTYAADSRTLVTLYCQYNVVPWLWKLLGVYLYLSEFYVLSCIYRLPFVSHLSFWCDSDCKLYLQS